MLPPDRSFRRRGPAATIPLRQPTNPGAWVQHSSASSLLGVAGRYGIPQHLMQQLAIEADAEAARRKGRSMATSLPRVHRPSSAPSHPVSHEGSAQYSASYDGMPKRGGHSRPQSAVPRMQRASPHPGMKAGAGTEWDEAVQWPPQRQTQSARFRRRAQGLGPPGHLAGDEPDGMPEQNDSDPELANWLAYSGKQAQHATPPADAFTLGSPSASQGSLHERAESGGWQSGVPMPVSWAAPRPPGEGRAGDYNGRSHVPPSILRAGGRPGPYGRAHHISLQSVAERA